MEVFPVLNQVIVYDGCRVVVNKGIAQGVKKNDDRYCCQNTIRCNVFQILVQFCGKVAGRRGTNSAHKKHHHSAIEKKEMPLSQDSNLYFGADS